MAKKQKYPDECPVFEYDGLEMQGRPGIGAPLTQNQVALYALITLVHDDGFPFSRGAYLSAAQVKPLTPAAQEMIAWAENAS